MNEIDDIQILIDRVRAEEAAEADRVAEEQQLTDALPGTIRRPEEDLADSVFTEPDTEFLREQADADFRTQQRLNINQGLERPGASEEIGISIGGINQGVTDDPVPVDSPTASGNFGIQTVAEALDDYQQEAGLADNEDPEDFIKAYLGEYRKVLNRDKSLSPFQRRARVTSLNNQVFQDAFTFGNIRERVAPLEPAPDIAPIPDASEDEGGFLSGVAGAFTRFGTNLLRSNAADNVQEQVDGIRTGSVDEADIADLTRALSREQELGIDAELLNLIENSNTLGEAVSNVADGGFGLFFNTIASQSIDILEEGAIQLGVTVGQGFAGTLATASPTGVGQVVGPALIASAPASGSAASAAKARENAANSYFAGQINQYLADNELAINEENVQVFLNDAEAVQAAREKANTYGNFIATSSFAAGLVGTGQVTSALGRIMGRQGSTIVIKNGDAVIQAARSTTRTRVAEAVGATALEVGGEVAATTAVGDELSYGEIVLEIFTGATEAGIDIGIGAAARRIRARKGNDQEPVTLFSKEKVDELRANGVADSQIASEILRRSQELGDDVNTEDINVVIDNLLDPDVPTVDVPRGTINQLREIADQQARERGEQPQSDRQITRDGNTEFEITLEGNLEVRRTNPETGETTTTIVTDPAEIAALDLGSRNPAGSVIDSEFNMVGDQTTDLTVPGAPNPVDVNAARDAQPNANTVVDADADGVANRRTTAQSRSAIFIDANGQVVRTGDTEDVALDVNGSVVFVTDVDGVSRPVDSRDLPRPRSQPATVDDSGVDIQARGLDPESAGVEVDSRTTEIRDPETGELTDIEVTAPSLIRKVTANQNGDEDSPRTTRTRIITNPNTGEDTAIQIFVRDEATGEETSSVITDPAIVEAARANEQARRVEPSAEDAGIVDPTGRLVTNNVLTNTNDVDDTPRTDIDADTTVQANTGDPGVRRPRQPVGGDNNASINVGSIRNITSINDTFIKKLVNLGRVAKRKFERSLAGDGGLNNADVENSARQIDRDRAQYSFRNDRTIAGGLAAIRKAKKRISKAARDRIDREAGRFLSSESTGASLPILVFNALSSVRNQIDTSTARIQQLLVQSLQFSTADKFDANQRRLLEDAMNGADIDAALLGQGDSPGRLNAQEIRNINLIKTLGRNKGSYLTRGYRAFNNRRFVNNMLQSQEFESAVTVHARLNAQRANPDAAPTTPTQEQLTAARTQLTRLLSNAQGETDSFEFLTSTREGAASDILKRRDLTLPPYIRLLLGEVTDPLQVAAQTLAKQAQLITSVDHSRRMREALLGAGFASATRQEADANGHSRDLTDQANFPYLEGLAIDENVFQSLESMKALEPIQNNLIKGLVQFSAFAKTNNTIFSLTTTMRNLLNGSLLMIRTGNTRLLTDERSFLDTLKIAAGSLDDTAQIENLIQLGVVGDGLRSQDTRKLLQDAMENPGLMQDIIFGRANGIRQRLVKTFTRTYSFGDDVWRLMIFESEKARYRDRYGFSPEAATSRAAETLSNLYPTYSRLPRGIRQLRRFPLMGTFVSFPWEMIRTAKNIAFEVNRDRVEGRPALAAQRAAGLALSGSFAAVMARALTESFFDEEDEALDREEFRSGLARLGPPWSQNSAVAYVGRDRNGAPRMLDLTAFSPDESLVRIARAAMLSNDNGGGFTDAMGAALSESLKPFFSKDIAFKALEEAWNNRDQFGNEIYPTNAQGKVTEGQLDKAAINSIGHLLTDGGLLPATLSRNLRSIVRSQDDHLGEVERDNEGSTFGASVGVLRRLAGPQRTKSGKIFSFNDEVLAGLGLRLTSLAPEASLIYRGYSYSNDVNDNSKDLKNLITQDSYVSTAQLSENVDTLIAGNRETYEQMAQDINSARGMGLTDNQILRATPRSLRDDVRRVMQGINPTVEPFDLVKSARTSFVSKRANNEVNRDNLNNYLTRVRSNQLQANEMIKNRAVPLRKVVDDE